MKLDNDLFPKDFSFSPPTPPPNFSLIFDSFFFFLFFHFIFHNVIARCCFVVMINYTQLIF